MIFPDCSDRHCADCAQAQSGKRIARRMHRHAAACRTRSRLPARCCSCRCRVGLRPVHRPRHPGRRRAADRGRHHLLVSADQGRRAHRRPEGRGRGQGAVRHRILPRRPHRGPGRRPGGHRAGAPDDLVPHVRRQQGIRQRHDQEGAEGRRHRRSAHLRPVRAGALGAGTEAPVHHARQVRGDRADHRHAAGTQSRRDQLQHRRRRHRQHRAHQHRRQQGVHGEAAALRDAADDAQLAVVVHEGRPVLQAEADRRPGGAAQLLPEPRLPRIQRRVDAGVDLAGQGGRVHHGEHRRGPALHGVRASTSSATSWSPRRRSAA